MMFKVESTGVEGLSYCRNVTFVTCDEGWEGFVTRKMQHE